MLDFPMKRIIIALAVIALFGIITFILAAATLGTVNKQYNDLKRILNAGGTATQPADTTSRPADTTTQTADTTSRPALNSPLAESIRIDDLMSHLNALQGIANNFSNTRAIGTPGFDATLNYIQNYLSTNAPNLYVFRQTFPVRNFNISGTPTLILSNNGNTSFVFSTDLPRADFTYVTYSASINPTELNITVVPNNGCSSSDWQNVTGRAALVMAGGTCTYAEKGELARSNNASALLFYNNGATSSNLAPVIVRLRQANNLPALFLSYATGQKFLSVANQTNAAVILQIVVQNIPSFNVSNICADTTDGNSNETIVVGSHSDSVPAGPGINDNGSGTMATLVIATNLARLYQSGNYAKYRYRVRFCWWGAEEIGLVGSIYHAQQAQNTSTATPGNRLQDYLINLNYDMLGSPNYFFGIYNGSSAKPDTPQQAINGSIKISEKFRDWFIQQNLPWDYTDFSGRSDYGPFLAAGVVAGGLFSGADDTKTSEQRTRYARLGQGQGGLAGAILDPCYHQACDTVDNINQYAYERMVQAAAHMLESLGRENNLNSWLYPGGRPQARLPDNYFPNSDYF